MSSALPPAPAPGLEGLILQLTDMGGPVMWVLLALAITGLVTFFYLMLFGALFAPRMTRRLRRAIATWQAEPNDAHVAALATSTGRLARLNPMVQLALTATDAQTRREDPEKLQQRLARDAQHALEPFEAPLKILEVIAALAPLLGLLGTVLGMMDAFSAMAASEGRANASQLSGGIHEALTTTAAGLVVAIPFAALAAWTEFRLRRISKTINSTLVTLLTTAPAIPEPARQQDARVVPAARRRDQHTVISEHHRRLANAAG